MAAKAKAASKRAKPDPDPEWAPCARCASQQEKAVVPVKTTEGTLKLCKFHRAQAVA